MIIKNLTTVDHPILYLIIFVLTGIAIGLLIAIKILQRPLVKKTKEPVEKEVLADTQFQSSGESVPVIVIVDLNSNHSNSFDSFQHAVNWGMPNEFSV